ncbi:MAG: hypothetical protein GX318_08240, partial [Clostridia bacterium]|nr:hypothetical protein [Clostridia bacterium]
MKRNFDSHCKSGNLLKKGVMDGIRHREKVQDAIKDNALDLLYREELLLEDGKEAGKLFHYSFKEYGFEFDDQLPLKIGYSPGESGG